MSAAPATGTMTIAGHPRASAQVRAAKGWAGLGGFGLAAVLSLRAGAPLDVALARGLATGVVLLLVAWACAVTVWRHLMVAELRARHAEIHARHRAAMAALAEAEAEGAERF